MKSTKDIYLAAVFIALGATYEYADKSDPRHMEFFFDGSNEGFDVDLNSVEKQWVNGVLTINAVEYKNAIQRMKSIIHSV